MSNRRGAIHDISVLSMRYSNHRQIHPFGLERIINCLVVTLIHSALDLTIASGGTSTGFARAKYRDATLFKREYGCFAE